MTALAAAHHHGHHKAPAHHCGLAIWCHTAPAQARHDAMVGHYAAAFVVLVLLFAAFIVLLRWRGRQRKAKAATTRRTAYLG